MLAGAGDQRTRGAKAPSRGWSVKRALLHGRAWATDPRTDPQTVQSFRPGEVGCTLLVAGPVSRGRRELPGSPAPPRGGPRARVATLPLAGKRPSQSLSLDAPTLRGLRLRVWRAIALGRPSQRPSPYPQGVPPRRGKAGLDVRKARPAAHPRPCGEQPRNPRPEPAVGTSQGQDAADTWLGATGLSRRAAVLACACGWKRWSAGRGPLPPSTGFPPFPRECRARKKRCGKSQDRSAALGWGYPTGGASPQPSPAAWGRGLSGGSGLPHPPLRVLRAPPAVRSFVSAAPLQRREVPCPAQALHFLSLSRGKGLLRKGSLGMANAAGVGPRGVRLLVFSP